MQRILVILIAALPTVAFAGTKLEPVTQGKTTVSVPQGYGVAVGERCIAIEGPASLWVIRTNATQEDFEKGEASGKGKRVARSGVVCYERTQPGENARCMITTEAGRWITQFVSFGKKYSALGGAAAMQAIVTSIKGWDGKPYDGTYPATGDCPVVK